MFYIFRRFFWQHFPSYSPHAKIIIESNLTVPFLVQYLQTLQTCILLLFISNSESHFGHFFNKFTFKILLIIMFKSKNKHLGLCAVIINSYTLSQLYIYIAAYLYMLQCRQEIIWKWSKPNILFYHPISVTNLYNRVTS